MEKTRECLEFMETEEFKAIDILQSIRDDSNVRFLDETLYEAIKELRTFAEDYRVVKKQNDYYDFENRSCFNCDNYGNQFDCAIKYIHHIVPDTFCCNKWEELL